MQLLILLLAALLTLAARADTPPMAPDIPEKFEARLPAADYVKRDVMIPMRDGVKLHTLIVVPKGATKAPILLTRTPYDASKRVERFISQSMRSSLPLGDEVFIGDGYIRVFQDVRGKHGSEGDYVMTRPVRGPLNATPVDHSTDAWDSIDWLIKNVPETNGRVGMLGSSYEGFTVLMALVEPHPALQAAVPMSPMVDGWKGDDWFHNGSFRQTTLDYLYGQTTVRAEGKPLARDTYDDYENFLRAGSTGAFAQRFGLDQLPFFRKIVEHPAYDAFWREQALDRILASKPLTVPTMYVASIWDQEDMYGAIATYQATEPKDAQNNRNYLVLGPWRHSGVNYDGSTLGALHFAGDTALQFRRDYMKPFFDQHLKDGGAIASTPPVLAYETGTNRWRELPKWPLACASGCASGTQRLYLQANSQLAFQAPAGNANAYDEYVSDPAKPVPYSPRPVRFEDGDAWKRWLVVDQRFVADRPDVLVYTSAVLAAPLQASGVPIANLFASTSGTDSDWVVKLIDVYPDEVPSQPELGGYQLPIAMDIFRGRYRDSIEHPAAIKAGAVAHYTFNLPHVNHVFLPGHRIMVQVQSSWFPLYDRNPQSFVPNIFLAKAADYRKATQRVYRHGATASYVEMPVVSAEK